MSEPRPLHLPEGITYSQSKLESAFANMIQDRFGATLSEPMVIEPYAELRRTSQPVEIDCAVAVFQYTRLNPLAGSPTAVVDAYKLANPSGKWLPPYADVNNLEAINHETNTTWPDIQEDKEKKHEGDPYKVDLVLTDPEYYASGIPLIQPAEEFEIALFTGELEPEITKPPGPITKGSVHGVRANFYGILALDPRYKVVRPDTMHRDTFHITSPIFDYLTNKAAYFGLSDNLNDDPSDEEILNEALEIYTEGEQKGLQVNIDFKVDSPSEIMDDLGNYIYVLAAGEC